MLSWVDDVMLSSLSHRLFVVALLHVCLCPNFDCRSLPFVGLSLPCVDHSIACRQAFAGPLMHHIDAKRHTTPAPKP